MIDLKNVHSLSDFQRNARDFVQRLKRSRRPVVLTVNGRAEVVVQDADSYQEMLDRLALAEATSAVKRGMDDFAKGDCQDARAAFDELRRKRDIPR